MMRYVEIVPIPVGGKEYFVTLILNDFEQPTIASSSIKPWYCAYVYLKRVRKNTESMGNETFREGKTVGIDTNHYHNTKMNLEGRRRDAIRQIKDVIEEYHSMFKLGL